MRYRASADFLFALLVSGGVAVVVQAETATFQYDVHGRLTQQYKQGGAADGTLTTIAHDPADNRSNYAVVVTTKTLRAGDKLFSADNRFYLTLKANGHLAVITAADGGQLWTSGTATQTVDRATFDSDGRLAILTGTNAVRWSSTTQGHPAAQLAMRNDGNLVIMDVAGPQLWQTGTGGH